MTQRTLEDLTAGEVALLQQHLDGLDAEIARWRRTAADLLHGVRTELSLVQARGPAHPVALRVQRILASLEAIAGSVGPPEAPRSR